jgi:hypothetical protein
MNRYKIGFFAASFAILFGSALFNSAYAICRDIKICQIAPTPSCQVYPNVCKEVPPQDSVDRYSFEIPILTRRELQEVLDRFKEEVDKNKVEIIK